MADIKIRNMGLITDTFVMVATDCKVTSGTAPKPRGSKPTVAMLQYELLTAQSYKLTIEDLMFEVYRRREGLTAAQAKKRKTEIFDKLFCKPYPCMRASPLPKIFGWSVHHDSRGRIAIYGVESEEYRQFASHTAELDVVNAMRSKRAS